MTILGLLAALIASAFLIWLANHPRVPSPWHWVLYGIVAVFWILVLFMFLPVDLGTRIG